MTDGESNMGPQKTADAFHKLVTRNKPLNCKVVSLGYGENFDPEVLNLVGTFVYVDNKEMIPVVLGNLSNEITESFGFNCTITVPDGNQITEITDDTIIVPDNNLTGGTDETGKVIVGNRVIGPLINNKTNDYVYLPHGNNISNITNYKTVIVSWVDINSQESKQETISIIHTHEPPPDVLIDLYFDCEKKRILTRLYNVVQKYGNSRINEDVAIVKDTIKTWLCEISEPHKDEIMKFLQDIEIKNNVRQASAMLNRAVGSGYTTNTGASNIALTSTGHYLMSPLVNNGRQF